MDTKAFRRRFEDWRGDGRMAVTPSFIVLGIATALIFVLSHYAFASRDTLLAAVPRDSSVYFHTERGASSLVPIPDFARDADEVAIFAVLDDTLDPSWGTLVAWHDPRAVSDADAEKLDAAGARSVSRGVWFAGSDAAGQKIDEVGHGADSLADDAGVSRALALMRSAARSQAYVNFGLVPSDMLSETLAPFHELEATVFGLSENGGKIRLIGRSANDAAKSPPLLGFGAPNGSREAGSARGGMLSVISPSAAVDPITLIFGDIETERIVAEYPETKQLKDAMLQIRAFLNGRSDIEVFGSNDGGTPKVAATVHAVPLDKLKTAIEQYVAAALPETYKYNLPDDDKVLEFKKPTNPPHFELISPSGLKGLWRLGLEDIGVEIFVGDLQSGNALITNDQTALGQYMAQSTNPGKEGCLMDKYPSLMTIKDSAILGSLGLKSLEVGQTVDNVLMACGLKK